MINKRTKRVFLILPFLLIIVGVVILMFPGILASVGCPPTCDGSTWNSNAGGGSINIPGNTIVAIKIHTNGPDSGEINSDGNYGNVVQVDSMGWPDPNCFDDGGPNFYSTFVLSSASYPSGYGWFGQYEVSGIGTSSVTVIRNKLFFWNDCILPYVSYLEYICTGDTTTTTEPTTTTTEATTTTTQGTTTTTEGTTTTTEGTTTTTEGTTTTTEGTTTTTEGTTTTTSPGTTTTTSPPGTTTTTDGTIEVLGVQELPFTGYDSLWYVIGAVLISLGILTGTFSLATASKRK